MHRILVFNGFYIPAKKYGGPLTSLVNVVDSCSDEYEFYIVAANHDLNEKERFDSISSGWNTVGKAKVLYIDLNTIGFGQAELKEIFDTVKPSLVWIVGILVPQSKWNTAALCRKLNIPFLISPRGELCTNAMKLKHFKKSVVINLCHLLNVYDAAYYHATI